MAELLADLQMGPVPSLTALSRFGEGEVCQLGITEFHPLPRGHSVISTGDGGRV